VEKTSKDMSNGVYSTGIQEFTFFFNIFILRRT